MSYTLGISANDMATLHWLQDRGYDCGLLDALEPTEADDVYTVAEHDAWSIAELAGDPDSGFACLNWDSDLGREIRRFLEAIV